MFPKDYDASKKYPLIISVHGGPSWACLSSWSTDALEDMRAASLLGWFVLCPNVRGSFGQGEALGCIADQFLPHPTIPTSTGLTSCGTQHRIAGIAIHVGDDADTFG